MSSQTDKMITKKIEELVSKGETETDEFLKLRNTSYFARLIIQSGFILSIPFGLFLLVIVTVLKIGQLWVLGILFLVMLMWFSSYSYSVQVRRLYKMIDTYREALIDKNITSVKEIATIVGSNLIEFIDELKELQGLGLFQQFRIDRKKMILIESADWGQEGSGNYEKLSFTCSNCGAKNEIYKAEGEKSFKCEYCGTANSI